jgi:hypothetical protein
LNFGQKIPIKVFIPLLSDARERESGVRGKGRKLLTEVSSLQNFIQVAFGLEKEILLGLKRTGRKTKTQMFNSLLCRQQEPGRFRSIVGVCIYKDTSSNNKPLRSSANKLIYPQY